MHIDEKTNRIISCGFPKFMALGDGSDKYNIDVDDLIAAQDVIATEKIDGTCLIRYVQNGKVKWRTKQSFFVNLENAFEINEFVEKYPALDDPQYCADITLIFEWVSPFNQIVVSYDNPAITLIGGITYNQNVPWYEADLKMLNLKLLKQISDHTGVPLVDSHRLQSAKDILEIIASTKKTEYKEGYVLRLGKEQDLVKIKSDWWLLVFACKLQFTTALAIELWLYWGTDWVQPNWREYQSKFIMLFSNKAWNIALPVVSSMFDGIRSVNSIVRHIEDFCRENSELSHDEFSKLAESRFNQMRLEICHHIRKSEPIPGEVLKKLVLQNCLQMEKDING